MTRAVGGTSTAVFRICFGLVGLILTFRFFAHGWIDALFIAPEFHFKYPGFGWVEPLPGIGMYLVFGVLVVSSASIALGLWHRVGAGLFAVGLAYVELIERTNFLNHYYWMILTAGLMVFLPMSRTWSLDAWRGRVGEAGWVPMWVVWLLRFQVGMVYFYAGVAKVNSDWLLRAEPLSTWLPARAELWLIGPLLAMPATAFALAWAGAIFDLTVVGWLLNRRTRLPAYVLLVGFHLTTWLLFPSIGVFPLVMSLGALVFFEPDWPRSVRRRIVVERRGQTGRLKPLWVAVAAVYVLAMLVVPVRHLAIPGDVRWTGEGYQGAWQVMLTDKTGLVDFVVRKDGSRWIVPPPAYLTDRQRAVMSTDPALIAQTARLIAAEHGGSVSARALVAVNGRRSVRFTDESVDIGQGPVATSVWVTAAP